MINEPKFKTGERVTAVHGLYKEEGYIYCIFNTPSCYRYYVIFGKEISADMQISGLYDEDELKHTQSVFDEIKEYLNKLRKENE